jgi:hypothetical protein
MAICLVRRTCLIGDIVLVDPLVGSASIATMAALIGELTTDEHLGR